MAVLSCTNSPLLRDGPQPAELHVSDTPPEECALSNKDVTAGTSHD